MKDLLEKKQVLKIVPKEISGASIACVEKTDDDSVTTSITKGSTNAYKQGDDVEAYGMTSSGILFFKTSVKDVAEKKLVLDVPKSFQCLQRREYVRIQMNKMIKIKKDETEYEVELVDISAGGLKIIANNLINVDLIYSMELNLEKNLIMRCEFQPLKVEAICESKFCIQGKFVNLKNVDRVLISQFCKIRQLEESSK